MEAMKELNRLGTTIIYVSHYMEEIEELCQRVVIADHGEIIEDMEKEALKTKYSNNEQKSLEQVFLGLTGTSLRDEEELR